MVNVKETIIRGVVYPSRQAAADAMEVDRRTIDAAIKRGTLDKVGLGRAGVAFKPITVRGVRYPSRTHAARALGVTKQTINSAILNGTLDNVGSRKGKNVDTG